MWVESIVCNISVVFLGHSVLEAVSRDLYLLALAIPHKTSKQKFIDTIYSKHETQQLHVGQYFRSQCDKS